MKKIFWTTVFRLIVVLGFAFYAKMFDANMAAGITTTASGEALATAPTSDVMSGITAIQMTLTDMQTTLNNLAGKTTTTTTTTTPVAAPDTTQDTTST